MTTFKWGFVGAGMIAGKHVLCEKPLGMNAAQVQEAIAVSEAAGVLFVETTRVNYTLGNATE